MNFKAYDILSTLIPGFLGFIVIINAMDIEFNNNYIVVYTSISFLIGYILNTIGSWLEDFYFFTWGGKPSSRLLNSTGIWKVRFYHSAKVRGLLQTESNNVNAKNDELFNIAMRYANGNTRVDDFNSMYAFSRTLLTTVLIVTIILLIDNHDVWLYYAVLIPSFFVCWLRCKQRAYYYAKEVLQVYLKQKPQS